MTRKSIVHSTQELPLQHTETYDEDEIIDDHNNDNIYFRLIILSSVHLLSRLK